MNNKRSKLKGEIKHKVVGWNKGYYHKMYSIFCSYQGDTVPATYVSHKKGGYGCVRDVIEQVMRIHGKWI